MTNISLKKFLISLVNASFYKKQEILINFSISYIKFLKSLKLNGFIRGFSIIRKQKPVPNRRMSLIADSCNYE